MRNRIIAIAAIAVLVIGAGVLALGHGFQGMHGGPGDGRRHGDMLEHMSRALELTDAQKQQVKAIMEAAHASMDANHAKAEEIHKQLDAATANGQFDEAQVRSLATQKAQIDAEMLVEHLRVKSKIFAILTPEQRTKAEELHKRGGPGGPHRRPGPPPPPGF